MKVKYPLAIVLVLLVQPLSAQSFFWYQEYGGPDDQFQIINDGVIDSDCNVYATSNAYTKTNYHNIGVTYDFDYISIKYDLSEIAKEPLTSTNNELPFEYYWEFLSIFKDKSYDANHRIYTEKELYSWADINKNRIWIFLLRNEIFARAGYAFNLEGFLRRFWDNCRWYRPVGKTAAIEKINKIEWKNIALIKDNEKRHGWDKMLPRGEQASILEEKYITLLLFFGSFDKNHNQKLELDEAHDFFNWIEENIKYEKTKDKQGPTLTIKMKKGECLDQAIFNAAFYSMYGVDCYVGFIDTDKDEVVDHACCLVRVDNIEELKILLEDAWWFELDEINYIIVDNAYSSYFGGLPYTVETNEYRLIKMYTLSELIDFSLVVQKHESLSLEIIRAVSESDISSEFTNQIMLILNSSEIKKSESNNN